MFRSHFLFVIKLSVYSLRAVVARAISAVRVLVWGGECVLGKLLCPTVMIMFICSHLK